MPLYYFDIVDGGPRRDDTGTECADEDEVREAAKQVLPDVAREEIPGESDRRIFTVIARDEVGHPIYTATLTFSGTWLNRRS